MNSGWEVREHSLPLDWAFMLYTTFKGVLNLSTKIMKTRMNIMLASFFTISLFSTFG